jgi:predicted metal-dependent hydrolase
VLAARLMVVAASLRWVRELPPLRLRSMKRQWGRCSPAGRLTLNPNLVKAPRECIDHVRVHELCHLKEHNHGPRFNRTLDAQTPGWREVKQRLDRWVGQIMPG